MITGRQIRAARGLLRWRVEDLARRASLTREAITRMEDESVRPRESSLAKILHAFDENGVEFVGTHGVSLKEHQVMMLEGDNVPLRLLEDVFHTLYGKEKAEALFLFIENARPSPAVLAAHQRLREAGVACRFLVKDKAPRAELLPTELRFVPEAFCPTSSAVIYGDKLATLILDPETGKDKGALVIKNPHLAAMQKQLFNLIWSQSPVDF